LLWEQSEQNVLQAKAAFFNTSHENINTYTVQRKSIIKCNINLMWK